MADNNIQRVETGEGHIEPTPMAMIQRAIEVGGDPERMAAVIERLTELEHRHQERRAHESYRAAIERFQSRCPMIPKRRSVRLSGSGGYAYASLEDLMAVIRPHLSECGLSVTFESSWEADMLVTTCIVSHGSHSERHRVPLPTPKNVSVNDTQRMGMAISYGRRYALISALGLVVCDEDNDAQTVYEPITEQQAVTIEELIEASGANRQKVLAYFGVESVASLPASSYQKAVSQLRAFARREGRDI